MYDDNFCAKTVKDLSDVRSKARLKERIDDTYETLKNQIWLAADEGKYQYIQDLKLSEACFIGEHIQKLFEQRGFKVSIEIKRYLSEYTHTLIINWEKNLYAH